MTFTELREIVKSNLEGADIPNLTEAMLSRWINSAQRWICQGSIVSAGLLIQHNFSFLVTETEADTIDEQRRYDLPSASGDVLAFKSDKNIELIDYQNYRHPLTKLFKKDIEDKTKFRWLEGKGTPSHFAIEQGDIWLYPLPSHSTNNDTAFTINIEYYGYLTDLSADEDTNILTTSYPEVLEYKATALGFAWIKDEQAGYYDGLAKEKLAEIITEDQGKIMIGLERGIAPIEGQSLGE